VCLAKSNHMRSMQGACAGLGECLCARPPTRANTHIVMACAASQLRVCATQHLAVLSGLSVGWPSRRAWSRLAEWSLSAAASAAALQLLSAPVFWQSCQLLHPQLGWCCCCVCDPRPGEGCAVMRLCALCAVLWNEHGCACVRVGPRQMFGFAMHAVCCAHRVLTHFVCHFAACSCCSCSALFPVVEYPVMCSSV
jgi:hypothetical protein